MKLSAKLTAGFIVCSLVIVGFSSCSKSEDNETNAQDNTENAKTSGFDEKNFDKSVRPQDDLNLFVSGGWVKNNPVPASESRWTSFNEIAESNRTFLMDILNEASSKVDSYEKGSNMQKIGDFYKLAMDSVKLNKEGIDPLKPYLAIVDAVRGKDDLPGIMGKFKKMGVGGLYGFYVYIDMKKSDEMIPYISQGGTGLPDVDYYSNDMYADIRAAYVKHIENMLTFTGQENAAEMAEAILKMETNLAANSMTRVQRRNADSTYHKFARTELGKMVPNYNFEVYFDEIGIGEFDSLIVSQPKFLKYLATTIEETDIEVFKAYMKWNMIRSYSGFLSDDIGMESFNFYSKTLRGTKERKPRWKRSSDVSDSYLGEILGQEYVKVAFSEEAKQKVNEMVDNLTAAYEDRIKQLSWMSDETKQKALEKLKAVERKLCYPDVWKDYSSLSIEDDSYMMNAMRCREWSHYYNINKLGKPVDKTEWGMTPSTVNAYYSPLKNEIVFPAGIMQPPFFDANADDAANYGGIGAVIGHELSHGFDDQGSKYDADGNLKSWWTDEDREKFEKLTKQLSDQFSAYVVQDSLNVNGDLTLGENIADLGGITMAYYAYQKQLEKTGRKDIDGFTPEQRFFMGWAQVWRVTYTPEEMRTRLVTDPHSLGMFRANGPPSNMEEFYKAFDVKDGDQMYRSDSSRIVIW